MTLNDLELLISRFWKAMTAKRMKIDP